MCCTFYIAFYFPERIEWGMTVCHMIPQLGQVLKDQTINKCCSWFAAALTVKKTGKRVKIFRGVLQTFYNNKLLPIHKCPQ